MKKWGYIGFLLLAMLQSSLASDQVVINSQDWTDVYSGMIYARLNSIEGSYVIDEGHALMLQDTLKKTKINVTVIESVSAPYIRNYNLNLETRGFDTEVIQARDNLNLLLADLLQAEGYIIIDKRYSYNAISVAPYAVRKNYYVMFADADNIDDVSDLLNRKDAQTVIIYGFVDREVTSNLEEHNPIIINKGDKFSNNLEILKMYNEEFKPSQLVLTNGGFMEPQFFQGTSPVLFIGQSNIPDQTLEHLRDSNIKHAILIGYDLFDNAVALKNAVGMRVIVKFAKGIGSKQYALDVFELPQAMYSVAITSVDYNTRSKKLEISYFNPEESPAFMKASHTVLKNNNSVLAVADEDIIFIGNGEVLTSVYDADLSEHSESELVLRSNLLYGEDIGALEFLKMVENPVNFIIYEDRSDIDIIKVYYEKSSKRFVVGIKNTGKVPVYASPRIRDIAMNNKRETLTGEVNIIEVGKTGQFRIKAILTPEDIEDNKQITVGVRYGTREKALIHYKEEEFDLKVRIISGIVLIGGVLILVAIALTALIMLVKRKKKAHRHRKLHHHSHAAHRHLTPPPPRR